LTSDNTSLQVAENKFQYTFVNSLNDVKQQSWNALLDDDHPFLRYEFLNALEQNDCLGEKYGWYPHHLIVTHDDALVAAMPLYIKTNSYGEFVFDWSWAGAYEQSGMAYYPKIVSSIPYTPVTGKRLLFATSLSAEEKSTLAEDMLHTIIEEAKKLQLSGAHCLFHQADERNYFKQEELMFRLGVQYHWHNHSYADFDDFLKTFNSRKRKKVKRERRYVVEQNIEIKCMHGNELDDIQWQAIHFFYSSTFHKKSGIPTLSLDFFKEIGKSMGKQIVLMLAYHEDQLSACAINFKSSNALFGRFWGCLKDFNSLHFELCYYQGIEYAIQNKLQRFEPGAQGEHKISRGFLPNKTWSAHYIVDDKFEPAIRDFCQREKEMMLEQYADLMQLSPYKQA